jgi:Yip1-like protein
MSDPNQPFQPPPPPPFAETPSTPAETMPTSATLTGIFFEPGRVFEALRERPRFLAAGLILLLLTIVVTVVLFLRVDMGQFIRDQMDKSPRNAQMSEQEKEMGVKFGKIIGAVAVPASVPITIAAGAALYMLGVMAFGGSITYKQSLSVWVYSSLPPTVLGTIVAIMVLFLKAPDQVNPERLLVTNPGAFMGPDTSAVLTAVLAQFDLLRFYGLFLAALGLRKVARMSSGAAWGVVITLWLLGAIIKVASAAIFGG